jgi:RHS repeat-associated protein
MVGLKVHFELRMIQLLFSLIFALFAGQSLAHTPAWSPATWQAVTNTTTLGSNTESEEGGLLLPPLNQGFSYDLDGNLTNDGVWSYTWDAANRLVSMTSLLDSSAPDSARKKLDFHYDSIGRRICKTVSTWDGSAYSNPLATVYLYDGWNLLAEIDTSLNLLRTYTWGRDLSGTLDQAGGIGGLLFLTDHTTNANETYYPFYDGNGNVAGLLKEDGSIAAQYEYSPFGQQIRATGPMAKANPFRYSTKFQDDESGLSYYGYRYYSPSTGRWLSFDPAGEAGGLNLYGFVGNDPLNFIDPYGLYTFGEAVSIGGAFIQGAGIGLESAGEAAWGFVTAPYTVTSGLSAAAGTLSTAYGRRTAIERAEAIGQFIRILKSDPCFRERVKSELGQWGKEYFTDPYKLSELLAQIGVAAGSAGPGVWTESAHGSEKLAQITKLISEFKSERIAAKGAPETLALVPKGMRSLGQWGETRLAQVLGEVGVKPAKPFSTSLGSRYIDRLVNGIAHESKAGFNVGLNGNIERQILKDAELIQAGRIQGAHWHFFQGAQSDVLEYLTKEGISYTVY